VTIAADLTDLFAAMQEEGMTNHPGGVVIDEARAAADAAREAAPYPQER